MIKRIMIILMLGISILTFSETIRGRVSYVADGDTIHVMSEGKRYKIRIYGVDTPEMSQEYGDKAKIYALKELENSDVKVDIVDTDRYGRSIGKVYYGKKYYNYEVIASGNAWWYEYYAKNELDLERAQEIARERRLGIWGTKEPMAPWEYRKLGRNKSNSKDSGAQKAPVSGTVYITKTGKKYHRKGCRYLKSIYMELDVDNATNMGYTRCSKY